MSLFQRRFNSFRIDINNTFDINEELKLLKTAAIYGANASGKSNLAGALGFMRWFIINSSKETQSTDKIDVEPFQLSTEADGKPSHFEIAFFSEFTLSETVFFAEFSSSSSSFFFAIENSDFSLNSYFQIRIFH